MSAIAADRNLLFGLLALQNGLIDQVQLVAAFQAWTLEKPRSLADQLEARGDLTGAKRAALEVLAAAHIETHGGDVGKSLAVVPANQLTRASLAALGEPEIEATLARSPARNPARKDSANSSRGSRCEVLLSTVRFPQGSPASVWPVIRE
jgi:hypothetical protein